MYFMYSKSTLKPFDFSNLDDLQAMAARPDQTLRLNKAW
jgi:hypothetical protein